MRAPLAAQYCGLSLTDFNSRAQAGEFRAASPQRVGKCNDKARITLYLRDDLDALIDGLFGLQGSVQQAQAQQQLAESISRRKTRGRQNQVRHQAAG